MGNETLPSLADSRGRGYNTDSGGKKPKTFSSLSVFGAHEAKDKVKLWGQTQCAGYVLVSTVLGYLMAPLPLQQRSVPFRQGWVGVPRAEQTPLPEDAVPACSRPPLCRKIWCDKVVGYSLLIHYLGDLRCNINQSSPEGALTHTGTMAVPYMGQGVGSLQTVQSFVIVPSIS